MLQQLLLTALIMIGIDFPYLTLTAANFRPMIQKIQGSALEFKLWPAVPVYLALSYLLNLATNWKQAALIGGATYAVYDFTNLATLKDYTLSFAIQDTLWGATLFAIVYYVKNMLHI